MKYRRWTSYSQNKLTKMAQENTNTNKIAKALNRSKAAIYNKASELGVSLNPRDTRN